LFHCTLMTSALGAAAAAASLPASAVELMLIADDEKITWDEAGKAVFMPPGKDHVLVVDIGTDPLAPQVLAMSIRALIEPAIRGPPLINTIFGPPINLAITPNQQLALVAKSMDQVTDNSISVLKIAGKSVKLIDTVPMGEQVAHVAIAPGGKRAVAAKCPGHKVALLDIDGKKVTRTNEVEVRGLPEGAVFSEDGKYLYVGNFLDGDVSILSVDGDKLVDTGKRMARPGHPAAMRGRAR